MKSNTQLEEQNPHYLPKYLKGCMRTIDVCKDGDGLNIFIILTLCLAKDANMVNLKLKEKMRMVC